MTVQVVRVGGPGATTVVNVGGSDESPTIIASGRRTLDQLTDVDTTGTPQDIPVVFRLHPDGIWRPEALPPEQSQWGDHVRFGIGPPTDDAPPGVVHVDVVDGRIYRNA